jgi:hypothetical protein
MAIGAQPLLRNVLLPLAARENTSWPVSWVFDLPSIGDKDR